MANFKPLSAREKYVVMLTAQGFTAKDIAEYLRMSSKTVETYRLRAYTKLKMRTRRQLFRYALDNGLLDNLVPPEILAKDGQRI